MESTDRAPWGKPGMWWHGSPESLSQAEEGSSNHFLEQVVILAKHLRVPHLRLWAQAHGGSSEAQVRSWRDSPVVKSTYCSYRGHGFCFQHSSHVTQNCLSLQFQGICPLGTWIQVVHIKSWRDTHTHTHMHIYIHKNKYINLWTQVSQVRELIRQVRESELLQSGIWVPATSSDMITLPLPVKFFLPREKAQCLVSWELWLSLCEYLEVTWTIWVHLLMTWALFKWKKKKSGSSFAVVSASLGDQSRRQRTKWTLNLDVCSPIDVDGAHAVCQALWA